MTTVEIAPGVRGRRTRTRTYRHLAGLSITVTVRYDESVGRYLCSNYAVGAGAGSSVTTGLLREITAQRDHGVESLVRATAWGAVRETRNTKGVEPWGLAVPDLRDERAASNRRLAWVAHCYRLGYALDAAAAAYVQTALDVPATTAARWISAARAAGLIGDVARLGRTGQFVAIGPCGPYRKEGWAP